MKILLRSVRIVDKSSSHHNQVKDLLIENGQIREIGDGLSAVGVEVVEKGGMCVSPGWVDMRVALRDPGFEHKEDLASVQEVAARGGFTEVVMLPNAAPVVDTKDTLNYVKRSGSGSLVKIHATAAVTKKADGVDFTDMIDLHRAGAAAFTDGENPIQNPDILLKALLYLRPFNALLMNRPEDRQLTLFGQMHEGVTSTLLGMKGMPVLAEEMMLSRDLKLLEYAMEKNTSPANSGSWLHISLISSAVAVELVRQAKAKGLPVTCDIAAHQLAFEDADLMGFDTNLKVNPPFRNLVEKEALLQGLADGTIDAVVSDHSPHDEESKNLEFDHADFGITGLETVFSVVLNYGKLSLEELVTKLSANPRAILRQPILTIEEGAEANLTIFNPEEEWKFDRSYSKSQNTPFLGQTLPGKVVGVMNQGLVRWF